MPAPADHRHEFQGAIDTPVWRFECVIVMNDSVKDSRGHHVTNEQVIYRHRLPDGADLIVYCLYPGR